MENIGFQFGEEGAIFVEDTNAHSGNFFALQAISDVVINSVTAPKLESGSLAGETITKGMIIYLNITAITLTSGKALLYKAGTK